jgi:mevalonate pyrophosphate decarboxylase
MAALAMNFMSLEKVLILKCLFLPKASLLARLGSGSACRKDKW